MTRLAISVVLAGLLACTGCDRSGAAPDPEAAPAEPRSIADTAPTAQPAPHPRLAPRAPRALTAPHMQEDPVLAARTSAATDERRANKRHMRFLTFDGEHLALHRALLEVVASARARYDGATSEKALGVARAAMPAMLKKLEEGITTLDSKGMGSRLLDDYKALHAALSTRYPDAKLAALRGDAVALSAERASFDERMAAMKAWLDEVRAALKADAESKPR